MKKVKFLLGSDPEAFIVNDASGMVVSAKRFTSGAKHEPEDFGRGYALLNDNILIEGNVPPASTREEFCAYMNILHMMMSEKALTRGAHLHNSDCEEISEMLLQTDEAQEFGCSSFRDAWNENIEIETPQLNGSYRPAGCHIHLGFNELTPWSDSLKMAIVRAFDIFVTLPCIEISGMNYRTSNLYGILGACRPRSYGIEARSLGGTFFNPKYFGWIYDKVEEAINFAVENEDMLVNLPSITTYIGEDRINIVKKYKKMILG
jgi:hypothetical protein